MAWSWNLRACGRHGHATYAPDEPDLAARLRADTAVGEAWRCLRCGAFVPGPPAGSGPADHAPVVLRDEALRDAVVLRLLAVERAVRGLVLAALAYGILRFEGARGSLQRVFEQDLPLLAPLASRVGVDLQGAGPVHLIRAAFTLRPTTLGWLTAAVAAYALLELAEAVGLWVMARWGEYLTAVGTAAFVPLEVDELVQQVTLLRVGAFTVNVAAIVYLVWTKRLFGVRGGHEALLAERHRASLLEVERAALGAVR